MKAFYGQQGVDICKTPTLCPELHYSISYEELKKESCMHQVQKRTNI